MQNHKQNHTLRTEYEGQVSSSPAANDDLARLHVLTKMGGAVEMAAEESPWRWWIQCDAAQTRSRCDWCRHHGIPCTFVRPVSRSTPARAKTIPPAPVSAPAPPRTPPALDGRRLNTAALGQIYVAGRNLGSFCSRSGIPYFTPEGERRIHSQTGRWPSLRRRSPNDAEQQPLKPPRAPGSDLPDRSVVETLLATYLASDFRLVFPLIDGTLFCRTLDQAYSSVVTLQSRCARACVFAFLSIASSSRFLGADVQPVVDDQECATEASALLRGTLELVNLVVVQTLLILLTHETFCGRLQAASMYHALACRSLFTLDAHVQVDDDGDRERRHLRVLFWFGYVFDKDVALCTGRPPIMDDDFCDLTLPAKCDDGRSAHDDSSPWFPGDLRLSVLKSRACRQLYSAASLQKPEADLLRTIRELDEALEGWRLSLPGGFCPSLAPGSSDGLNRSRGMLHMELHLQYYYLVNVIHAAAGRCALADGSGEAVRSSLDLSVEASRATLLYLSMAAHRLISEGFWVFIFYPMSAVVTLFFHVLRNPGDAQAAADVRLLSQASDVIKTMPVGGITARERAYLLEVDGEQVI
ncbi:hypothetical protein CDD80_3406 [Ophiocordyceps camponoti-rufipedis]|uniref:Xylanolytic transcriptional activator regulatory domain-containing protein n=1 Tax=Ophiocordyceps camponoti-rufipedis TaxID=2004952 RepID=A0A2C5Z3V0_9HYPO|nr:hypothetical protein CDD80_3406 [Ophiocordyceps camponoti-rufipedis]